MPKNKLLYNLIESCCSLKIVHFCGLLWLNWFSELNQETGSVWFVNELCLYVCEIIIYWWIWHHWQWQVSYHMTSDWKLAIEQTLTRMSQEYQYNENTKNTNTSLKPSMWATNWTSATTKNMTDQLEQQSKTCCTQKPKDQRYF